MHPWVIGVQVCSIEGPRPFSRGDNYEIEKNTLTKLNISSPEPLGLQLNLAQSIPAWVKGIQVCSNEKPFNSHKVINGFFLS